ncbi:hypothetical protein RJ55_03766 [Drechmeria coniospora]|nr:hypothetical protein RJ55_03766 [Drechmeria coniospora]
MMTSSRPRDEVTGSFSSRRGHASQLSISDPSHHVTEAIGTLYGDEDDSGSEGGRPLSFMDGSSYHEQIHRTPQADPNEQNRYQHADETQRHPALPVADQPPSSSPAHGEHGSLRKMQSLPVPPSSYDNGSKLPPSPTLSLRDVQADSTGSQFPLTNIDNPQDIAQELSNLQALRRLSMDVGNSIDPDMPPMSLSAIPAIAPSGDDDENDPSRLLWVPARVHPELAPTEFKSFLEKRVQSIKRRSGDSWLSAESDFSHASTGSGLTRQKSMLSRQIDNSGGRGGVGYVDGAERLERQRCGAGRHGSELSLEELVRDPTGAVQRLAQESQDAPAGMEGGDDDMPILPMAPGVGLRRSTRTTYRKGGSLRSGDRGSLSKRLAQRHQESESPDGTSERAPEASSDSPLRANYSRPSRPVWRQNSFTTESPETLSSSDDPPEHGAESQAASSPQAQQDQPYARASSTSSNAASMEPAMPQERIARLDNHYNRSFPQRSSSQSSGQQQDHQPEIVIDEAPSRSTARPALANSKTQYTSKSSPSVPTQSLHDALASPSSLAGGDASRTDSLTFIPTLAQAEKKPEKKSKKDRDDDSPGTLSRSGSAWKWLKGVADDRDKKKEESRKSKSKALAEKSQDNARLDVIQTSIDKTNGKGRESLVLDRDSIEGRPADERKKEGSRKSDSKKDKDGSIFSSIFGSKKKEEKDKANKKSQHLQVPDEPAYKPLRPDVDYSWTRFPLMEERAIYRMAHIKLANPRRPLLSQVLLSNFMYSYLAIVQAMHPQMNVPTSPQQKRLEEEARRKRQEQAYASQQREDEQSEHSLDQYNYNYHRYADAGPDDQVEYVDDAQIYEDEHGNSNREEYGYGGYGHDVKDYYHFNDIGDDNQRHDGESDMW